MSENLITGHGSNIRNFKVAIKLSEDFGRVYDPCNDYIKIPTMQQTWQILVQVNETYNRTLYQSKVLIRQREIIFKELNKKITKLCAIAGSLKETDQFKQEVKSLADKIRGFKYKKTIEAYQGSEQDSNLNLSYVMRTENFKLLISVLASSSVYKPNELTFSTAHLHAEHEKMYKLNEDIDHKMIAVHRARSARNKALYDAETGVLQTMKACRSYVKGLFGAGSAEYKMFSALKFRVLPKKYNNF